MTAMLNTPDLIVKPGQKLNLDIKTPVHFIGVGGIGMSGLARILVDKGYKVSGSDKVLGSYTQYLADNGATLHENHAASQVPENSIVVASTAISPENPEIQEALKNDLPIVHRSDLLREILHHPQFSHNTVIGISGTHGKTSTTGMVAVALEAAKLSTTAIAGGIIPEFNTNAKGGNSGIAVAELDESDGTLIQYQPKIAVVLNLELDHAEHFPGGFNDFVAMFKQFLTGLPETGKVWLNANCTESIKLFNTIKSQVKWQPILFSDTIKSDLINLEQYEYYALTNIKMTQPGCYGGDIIYNGKHLDYMAMGTAGKHQLTNGLVALSIAHQLDIKDKKLGNVIQALKQFKGMKRRFEIVGHYNNATLVDDYAHHPTEVAAILDAAKSSQMASNNGNGKLIAIFQPHRYTRLKTFWQEFQTCFNDADEIIVIDVFEASESPIEGINSKLFCDELRQQKSLGAKNTTYFAGKDFDALIALIQSKINADDWVISLGAGDITKVLRGWQ